MKVKETHGGRWLEFWKHQKEVKERIPLFSSYLGEWVKKLGIEKGEKILDIGCGAGTYLSLIASTFKAECYGLDISEKAFGLNKNPKFKFILGDMHNLPFPNSYFDKVISLGVFEHTEETNKVFKEASRVLKKNGKLLVTLPNKNSFFHLTKIAKILLGKWGIGYEKSFSIKQVKKVAGLSGFEILDYGISKHEIEANLFNRLDNKLNKINPRKYGFFIFAILKKQ